MFTCSLLSEDSSSIPLIISSNKIKFCKIWITRPSKIHQCRFWIGDDQNYKRTLPEFNYSWLLLPFLSSGLQESAGVGTRIRIFVESKVSFMGEKDFSLSVYTFVRNGRLFRRTYFAIFVEWWRSDIIKASNRPICWLRHYSMVRKSEYPTVDLEYFWQRGGWSNQQLLRVLARKME